MTFFFCRPFPARRGAAISGENFEIVAAGLNFVRPLWGRVIPGQFSIEPLGPLAHPLAQRNSFGSPPTRNHHDPQLAMASGNPVIGLLGGGQLGRMLCEAAGPLGIEVAVLDAAACPTKQMNTSRHHVTGSFKDAARIRDLARNSDFLSVEIEHVDADTLADIADNGVEVNGVVKRVGVHPAPRSLALIRDKFAQKAHFEAAGIPVAKQMALDENNLEWSLADAGKEFGFPFMVKSRMNSYDGRGNFVVEDSGAFGNVTESLGREGLYAEKMVPFTKELAVMVIRAQDEGPERTYAYPAVETVHQDSICTTVYMPPRGVPKDVCAAARTLASQVVGTLWGRGVFAVEMFLTAKGTCMLYYLRTWPFY